MKKLSSIIVWFRSYIYYPVVCIILLLTSASYNIDILRQAGMFYWIRSVQTYDSDDGWNYISNLKAFVQGGLTDDSFIDGVSGIVNRVSGIRPYIISVLRLNEEHRR